MSIIRKEQLAKTIEEKYLPMEKADLRNAFDNGEINVWNGKRDESRGSDTSGNL